ncbi:SapC family protein [Methylorubrum podarium]|uniref:SapC family protein n=1 Tax=Methylorubrum podarium TaxID=200476 RepID=UPI001EE32A2C|nr:SapC family protein [Methylorubrum podarium]GJE70804.1 hypothetical protein CHKEEEPN_2345 [Methylorubrum podarium]
MTGLPLFYRSVVPLDRERHRTLALAQPQRFDFARASHLVPAVIDEFGPACRHLPILFLPESLGPTPVFLVGVRPGRSALVGADGAWTGRYLPAYLRRYPFIVGEVEDAEPLICFDETAPTLVTGAESETPSHAAPLFGGDGADSPLLAERVGLVIEYAAAAQRTALFGRVLQDLALLRPLTVEGQDPADGARHTLHGVLGVDEAALAALAASDGDRLRREGWLGPIHAHLVSLQSIGDFTLPFAAPPAGADGAEAPGAAV